MKTKLTIKSLLALSLAMLIGLFSLHSLAEETMDVNTSDAEPVKIEDGSMPPDEELLDEKKERLSPVTLKKTTKPESPCPSLKTLTKKATVMTTRSSRKSLS